MSKGQKKSNREAKKPKKSEAEKLKAKSPPGNFQSLTTGSKVSAKKS